MPAEMKAVLHASVAFGWRSRPVRLLMIVSFVHGGFLMWAFYAWQPYFLELLGSDAVWVAGIVAALIAPVDDRRQRARRLPDPVLRQAHDAAPRVVRRARGLSAAGVGLVDSFLPASLLFLVAMGAVGVGTPVQQAYLHAVIPSSERATVVSFGSLVGSAGGIGGSLGLGYLARAQSVATAYVTGGLAHAACPSPARCPAARCANRLTSSSGEGGQGAGHAPAKGFLTVSSLDTTSRQPEPVS